MTHGFNFVLLYNFNYLSIDITFSSPVNSSTLLLHREASGALLIHISSKRQVRDIARAQNKAVFLSSSDGHFNFSMPTGFFLLH